MFLQTRGAGRRLAIGVTLAVLGAVAVTLRGPVLDAADFIGANKTYTTDADFDLGTLFNTNHDAPNNNQLQLNAELTTLPFMWIANAGEDTVSKIDTTTGREVARYRTGHGPAGQAGHVSHLGNAYAGPAPSRTAIDTEGNLYIANRRFDNRPAEVMKILATGGVDRNGNGVIDTSSDLDNNGVISGAEILPMADLNGDGRVQLDEVQDERVVWVSQVGSAGALGRSLCRDTRGHIWLGLYNTSQYFKLDSATGATLAGPISTPGHTPYGCLVDGTGRLWGASLGSTLLEFDTNTDSFVASRSHAAFGSDYGIAIGNGKVYQALYGGGSFVTYDPATNSFSNIAASSFGALGIAVDSAGNIVVGNTSGGVTKFSSTGAVIWAAPAQGGTGEVRGVQVDSNGDVWLVHRTTANLSKYNGTTGAAMGVFPVGDQPYTYSDATGIAAFSTTNPLGRWTIVQDSGTAGNEWDRITWNTESQGATPDGTSIVVEARVADVEADLGGQSFAPITNGAALSLTGRFIEVRATLQSSDGAITPVLSDISVLSRSTTALSCDLDNDGDVDIADIFVILRYLGKAGTSQPAQPGDPLDVNRDGVVDGDDSKACKALCTRPFCAQGTVR